MMNFLHPLSPRFRGFLYAFIILFSLVGVCYFLCLCLGSMDFFQALLSKVGFSLGNRALCSLFIKIGCPMSLAFAIGFLVKTFLAAEVATYMNTPDSGASSSFPKPEWERALSLPDNQQALPSPMLPNHCRLVSSL